MLNLTTLPASDNLALFHVAQQQHRDDAYQDALKGRRLILKGYTELHKLYDATVEMIRYTELCASHYYYNNGSTKSLELGSHYADAVTHLKLKCDDQEVLDLLLNMLRYAYEGQKTWRLMYEASKAVNSLEVENKRLHEELASVREEENKLRENKTSKLGDVHKELTLLHSTAGYLEGKARNVHEDAEDLYNDLYDFEDRLKKLLATVREQVGATTDDEERYVEEEEL